MLISKILYAVLLCILIIFWILYRGTLSLQLFILAAAVPFVMLGIVLIQRFLLDAAVRRSSAEVRKGDTFQWILQLRNRSLIPVSNAEVQLEYGSNLEGAAHRMKLGVSLLSLNTQKVKLTFHAGTCGMMEMRLCSVKIYDPLRLFSQTIRFRASDTFLVMPECMELELTEHQFSEAAEEDNPEYSKNKSGDDPSEVFEIHEYRSGDAVSRIHWKLSSKLDELMVKAYSLPIPSNTLLMPDYRMVGNGADGCARLDTMLSAVYAVSNEFRSQSLSHSALWYRNAQNAFAVCQLTEPEDTEEMLRQILQNTPSDYDPEAMLDVIEQEVRAARIILFTPKLDDRLIALLPQLSNHRALTIFYVISGGESEELPAGAEGYDCVPVRILSEALEDDSHPDREGEDEC